jgi:hypothetical protein
MLQSEMQQPRLVHPKHSFTVDEGGRPNEFMCPRMKKFFFPSSAFIYNVPALLESKSSSSSLACFFFLPPWVNRAKVGAEAAAASHEGMLQRNSDKGAPGTRHCNDDCMQAMCMGSTRWMNKEGIGWQRNTATLKALGFWMRGSEPFKIHQVKGKAICY